MLHPRIDELADQIRQSLYNDSNKDSTNEEFEDGLTTGTSETPGLKSFVSYRFDFIDQLLPD